MGNDNVTVIADEIVKLIGKYSMVEVNSVIGGLLIDSCFKAGISEQDFLDALSQAWQAYKLELLESKHGK